MDRFPARFPLGLFKLIAALAGLYVLAAWGFAGPGDTAPLLAVVSLFFGLAVGLVALLYRTRRCHGRTELGEEECRVESLAEWIGREVETSTGRLRGSAATTQIVLPLAAVAVGMVLFAVTVHFAGHT